MTKPINKRHRPGAFTKGDPRVTGPKAAANNQAKYRDEVTQTLISILNENAPKMDKSKLYVMLDRLVALGLGIEFKVGYKKFQFAPDRKAISDVLDRLIGRPKQTMELKPEGGKLVIEFGENEDND